MRERRKFNARFWARSARGLEVKITLEPGQTLTTSQGGATDEGYSYTEVSWHFDGRTVTEETVDDGRDCDGRLTHTFVRYLSRRGREFERAPMRVYDQYAEMAGY